MLEIILTAILLIVAILFPVYLKKVKNTLLELQEAVSVLADAISDNKVTQEELEAIKKEFSDIANVWKK